MESFEGLDDKVEVAALLFPRLADVENFDVVLDSLPRPARVRVQHSLGPLHLFNPLKVCVARSVTTTHAANGQGRLRLPPLAQPPK